MPNIVCPFEKKEGKISTKTYSLFFLQCPFSFKGRLSVFKVINISGKALPSPSQIPAHISGGRRVLKRKLGWWEELNAFSLLQIGSPFTQIIYLIQVLVYIRKSKS